MKRSRVRPKGLNAASRLLFESKRRKASTDSVRGKELDVATDEQRLSLAPVEQSAKAMQCRRHITFLSSNRQLQMLRRHG
jgi:hypothetical protein